MTKPAKPKKAKSKTANTNPGGNELVFVALGGAGEIGMNLNLYGYGPPGEERWIMLDLGVTFSDGWPPGVDVIMADPSFIEERADQLDGLVLTHVHEDHLGAVQYLWDRFKCPIYATPFTAHILARKLAEPGWEDDADVTVVPLQGTFSVGPFELELITLTHSIPEPNAVVVRTPLGTVLHTGDWKFDPGDRRRVGPGGLAGARRRRRFGHGLRFHQCVFAGPIRVRRRNPGQHDRGHRRLFGPGRRGLLRDQRGAA